MPSRVPRASPTSRLLILALPLLINGPSAIHAESADRVSGFVQITGLEPIVGGPCEGCEAVFESLPDELTPEARIAPPGEPGEPLEVSGTVFDSDGNPVSGTVVYAYQTNAEGIYPRATELRSRAARRHGLLRGWVVTDQEGSYRFNTVRPASYPDSGLPQHIHLHVIEPGRCTYYIDDIVFTDDPALSASAISRLRGRGGSGVVTPTRDADGRWVVERSILLGARIPGYSACASDG